jgi:hypothetical protein
MRSIVVPLELTVRLRRGVVGVENTANLCADLIEPFAWPLQALGVRPTLARRLLALART